MKNNFCEIWAAELADPSGQRARPEPEAQLRTNNSSGRTMVIDKGIGRSSFTDLMELGSRYIDCLKIGFGTAPLYSTELLLYKINLAKQHGIAIMPGGTLLETAVQQETVPAFFDAVCQLGFNAIEVSDGTIELPRRRRSELIQEGVKRGLKVFSEYGKKLSGSIIDARLLAQTLEADLESGSSLVTVEARESGINVGLFDEQGECRRDVLSAVIQFVPDPTKLMWEAPLKQQQVMFLREFGPGVHLGNIQPGEVIALEAMRRGLRQDTFELGMRGSETAPYLYMI